MTSQLFDTGAQPERTALAWRRAGLSMGVGSLAAARIFSQVVGPVALIPAGIALLLALVVLVAAHRRYRRDHRTLVGAVDQSGAFSALSGGALVTVTAAAVLGLALCGAVVLLVR